MNLEWDGSSTQSTVTTHTHTYNSAQQSYRQHCTHTHTHTHTHQIPRSRFVGRVAAAGKFSEPILSSQYFISHYTVDYALQSSVTNF